MPETSQKLTIKEKKIHEQILTVKWGTKALSLRILEFPFSKKEGLQEKQNPYSKKYIQQK